MAWQVRSNLGADCSRGGERTPHAPNGAAGGEWLPVVHLVHSHASHAISLLTVPPPGQPLAARAGATSLTCAARLATPPHLAGSAAKRSSRELNSKRHTVSPRPVTCPLSRSSIAGCTGRGGPLFPTQLA